MKALKNPSSSTSKRRQPLRVHLVRTGVRAGAFVNKARRVALITPPL